jgi:Rap1a immunity proteins
MRKLWGIALSAILILAAAPTGADEEFTTIGQLRQRCLEVSNSLMGGYIANKFNVGYCTGLLEGYAVGYATRFPVSKSKPARGGGFCEPARVDNEKRLEVFLHWANEHPAYWHEFWGEGVYIAFTEAWPCPK